MNIVIIDNEPSIRETLRTILVHYYSQAVIKEASGVEDGLSLLSSFRPDILFLDIELNDGTGFDLLTRLPSFSCPVVFVTAHNEHAVKAFKFSAIDYILKPIDPEEIRKAVEKTKLVAGNDIRVRSLLHNWNDGQLKRVVLSDQSNIYVVELDEIVRCQSASNYTHFFLTEGRNIIVSTTLKHFDDLLTGHGFFRVHQSHLVNLNHISKFIKKEGGEIVMKDGTVVPVSSRNRDGLLNLFKSLLH